MKLFEIWFGYAFLRIFILLVRGMGATHAIHQNTARFKPHQLKVKGATTSTYDDTGMVCPV